MLLFYLKFVNILGDIFCDDTFKRVLDLNSDSSDNENKNQSLR
jgi:hypothetical protein